MKRKTKGKSVIRKGSLVKLKSDTLVKHARSVPSHMGYTREQFKWRETLSNLKGKKGKVTRTFKDSKHVNVQFGKTLIGIDKSNLRKITKRKTKKKSRKK